MNSYYRTSQGNHRHASSACANVIRRNLVGIAEIPTSEVADWEPCSYCCDEATVSEYFAAKAAAPASTKCDGRPAHPRHIKSVCTECAHIGTSRSWRAHTPK